MSLRAAVLVIWRRGNLLFGELSYKEGDCFGTPALAGGTREERLAKTFVLMLERSHQFRIGKDVTIHCCE